MNLALSLTAEKINEMRFFVFVKECFHLYEFVLKTEKGLSHHLSCAFSLVSSINISKMWFINFLSSVVTWQDLYLSFAMLSPRENISSFWQYANNTWDQVRQFMFFMFRVVNLSYQNICKILINSLKIDCFAIGHLRTNIYWTCNTNNTALSVFVFTESFRQSRKTWHTINVDGDVAAAVASGLNSVVSYNDIC